jgi:hypothetical protein
MAFFLSIFLSLFVLMLPAKALAITDPLAVPNNKIGIHILFVDEITKAARLVNNEGKGEWGYVVIPIQSTDRDRAKWQKFFDDCKTNKIIPIIRLATTATGPHWDLPTEYDLVDFANFLNDLKWPVQNRYVIILNEVNRNDEFGGSANPEKYADVLNLSIEVFKGKSEDFFIMSAGLDNAASDRRNSIKWSTFLQRMNAYKSDIFSRVDGWVSHAYANPDFSARADAKGPNKINSFENDLQELRKYTAKNLPIFITEAGWSTKNLSEKQVGLYYDYALKNVWNNPQIVTVAPFLLNAQDGPFEQFSFIDNKNEFKEFAVSFKEFATIGAPKVIEPTPTPAKVEIIYASDATPSMSNEIKVLGTESTDKNIFKKLYNSFIKLFQVFK